VCWGNPVGLCISSFAQGDLEVGVYGVTYIPVWSTLVCFSIPFDGGLQSFDLVLKCDDCEVMDFFMVLDSLDQTGCDILEGSRVDDGGEYSFHGMG